MIRHIKLKNKRMFYIGKKVRRLREALGYSREELGHILDVTPGAIAHIERNKNLPYLVTAKYLAKALGITLDELCSEDKDGDVKLILKPNRTPRRSFKRAR